ncbi:MAG TPA: response regulator transcription factor [Candidatus Gallacutalibacter pullistercoris]|nr:response regulator transcription factor [Candidatus Gallacutalibacter pullistercoris]
MSLIAVVEDDASIRKLILYALKNNGYEACGFECGADFFESVSTHIPDLILLDIMLPDMDGVEILRRLRKSGATQHVPVMMITAMGTEYDKVNALDTGADDYMTKPFGVMEMLSRVRALLRRASVSRPESQDDSLLSESGVEMDTLRHLVRVDGQEVVLAYKEFELLHYFLQNKGIVLSREQLMQTVWGFDYEGESRTVDMHIKTLRQKLGRGGELIQTVRGVGYKLESREKMP